MGSSLESRNAVCALSVVSRFRFWVLLLGCLSCDATKRLISPPDPNLVQLDDHGHTVIPPRMGSCEVDTRSLDARLGAREEAFPVGSIN